MNMSAEQKYKETVQEIERILKYRGYFTRNYGNKGGATIENAYRTMRRQMDAALKEETIEATGKEKSCIKEALNIMLNVVLYKPINKMVRDLSIAISRLTFNWNQQIGHRPDIEQNARLIERIVTAQKTLDDTIEISKRLLERLQRELSHRPIAWELSKHYLLSLQEYIENSK